MVGISPATRHAAPDQSMGIPPRPRLWGHAYCRWLCRGHSRRRVPLVRRLRMGSLLPGSWGTEPRGWLLVHHYRSLLTSPSLSPRAATSPRFTLPTDRRGSSTRSGGVVDSSATHCEASPTPLATALRTGASVQATVRTDDRCGRVATVRRPPRSTAPSVTEQPRRPSRPGCSSRRDPAACPHRLNVAGFGSRRSSNRTIASAMARASGLRALRREAVGISVLSGRFKTLPGWLEIS
jgi:hypothetical protein